MGTIKGSSIKVIKVVLTGHNVEHDNVVILADKHTMPYLDGRSRSTKTRLPLDALIQASIYDINIRDFAPFGIRQLVKFSYRFLSISVKSLARSALY
uniref:Transposase_23 domain-containing protein n=1 Tax=Ascaris lumbricoides TaxID=6252 RepID=A0A0M3I7L2_ASCLU